jgi:hypothetical protein
MSVNLIFRDYGHRYAFDYDYLALLLEQQGFKAIECCQFRQCRRDDLLIDTESLRCESLYIQVTR